MSLPLPLARLLAAVIVMIAACVSASVVGASAAQAHQAHAHQGHAHHDRSLDAPTPTALTLAEARAAAQGPRLTAADPDATPVARPCNGLCCLMGASCCVPGLLPDALAAFPAPTPARRLTAAAEAVPPGIVPDSPARPPRSFA